MEQTKTPKFTVAQLHSSTEHTFGSLSYRYSRRRETPALLFEAPETAVTQILTDPDVQKTVGPVMVVTDVETGIAIHSDLSLIPLPDKAESTDVISYVQNGSLHQFPVLQRFSQCMEPARDLLGCSECAHKGWDCVSGLVHDDPLPGVISGGSQPLDLGAFKDRQTVLAGYRYVSPLLLAPMNENFVKGQQAAENIDWGVESERRELRSANSKKAAVTRYFKKTECGKCIAKAAGCTAVGWCKGAYQPAAAQTKTVLDKWLPRMAERKSGLADWQIYSVMWLAGEDGAKAWDRRRCLLGGLTKDFEVRIAATARNSDAAHAVTQDWGRLCKVFPFLPKTNDGAWYTQRPSDESLALYFAALDRGRLGPVLRGFQGYQCDVVAHLSVRRYGTGVVVGRERRWGIRSKGVSWGCADVNDWTEFWDVFRMLPNESRDATE